MLRHKASHYQYINDAVKQIGKVTKQYTGKICRKGRFHIQGIPSNRKGFKNISPPRSIFLEHHNFRPCNGSHFLLFRLIGKV